MDKINYLLDKVSQISNEIQYIDDLDQKVENYNTSLNDKIDNVNTTLSESIENYNDTINNKIDQNVSSLNEQISQLDTNLSDRIEEVNGNLTNSIEQTNTTLESYNTTLNNKIESYNTTLDDKIENYNTTLDNKIDNCNTTLDGKITTLDSKVESYNLALNTKIDTGDESLNTKIEEYNTEVNNKITQTNTTLTGNINQVNTNLTQQINQNHTTLDNKIEQYKGDLATSIQQGDNELSEEISQLNTSLTNTINDNKNILEGKIAVTRRKLSNYNYLINSNFIINQRGLTSYTQSSYGINKYTVDRLMHCDSNAYTLTPLTGGGIKIVNSSSSQVKFEQFIEDGATILGGKTLSMTICISGTKYAFENFSMVLGGVSEIDFGDGRFGVEYLSSTKFGAFIKIKAGKTIQLDYWKLELGEVATPYEPRFYTEELILCQRYYRRLQSNLIPAIFIGNKTLQFAIYPYRMRVKPTTRIIKLGTWFRGHGSYINTSSLTVSSISIWSEIFYDANCAISLVFSSFSYSSTNTVGILNYLNLELDSEIY